MVCPLLFTNMERGNDQKPDQSSGFNIDVTQCFANLTDQEVDDLLGNKHSEKTKKARGVYCLCHKNIYSLLCCKAGI